jgi:peptidoglycan/LPS O-acetylase OafA/YrhL
LTFLAQKGLLARPGGPGAMLQNVLLAGSLTAAASFLTYRYVEAPALALGRRRPSAREAPPPAANAELAS